MDLSDDAQYGLLAKYREIFGDADADELSPAQLAAGAEVIDNVKRLDYDVSLRRRSTQDICEDFRFNDIDINPDARDFIDTKLREAWSRRMRGGKPAAKRVAKKPVAKKPFARKPVAQRVATKPAAKKPVAAKKPAARKPAAKKPASKKPAEKKA